MPAFNLVSNYTPKGDQPNAIRKLSDGILAGLDSQVLLGVTGSGKTFTMAHVIATLNKPTLVLAPNKTLAAQLFSEFKMLFPDNAVEYFVSYYDYYQPEAYIPSSDIYIEKDSSINDMIDKMRHSATRSVLSRSDVIVVASVSCIYGLGAPEEYLGMRMDIRENMELNRDKLLSALVAMQYDRNDIDFHRGVFRVRGDRVEVFPSYEEDTAVRIEFFGDQVDSIALFDPLRGATRRHIKRTTLFPASHYAIQSHIMKRALETITAELKQTTAHFRKENRLIEAQRIEERTHLDLEMMRELGYCNGIENYSRHFTGRKAGDPPPTLLDYFPDDFLMFIDESHIAIPQLHAMYNGDRSRKETLVAYGFRLPSALDNRPLKFEETQSKINPVVYVSATPSEYELSQSKGAIVEQIVRPTGLIDPLIDVRKADNQVDDLYEEILNRQRVNERVLVTTLTKRMAEDLTEYYTDLGIKVQYLHSDITTLERMDIIKDLRKGEFDVLVGINLLREGLDLPEVSLVAILDADKEGFLRSARSLIQTFGRAARNIHGTVIMYANVVTKSMNKAMDETNRRRRIQNDHNIKHNITPATIRKEIASTFEFVFENDYEKARRIAEPVSEYASAGDVDGIIKKLESEMLSAAKELAFERAAELRDQINEFKKITLY